MKYALINGIILNGQIDMEPEKKCIIVEDGKIIDIVENAPIDIKTIDLKGKYVLPGLINLHVHLPGSGMPSNSKKQNKKSVDFLMNHRLTRSIVTKMCANYAKTELLSGVTTIRTVGGLRNIDTTIRNKINDKKMVGPRIIASNMAISVPGGHMAGILAYEATNEEEARMYVNKIAEDKPDLIKLMITGGVLDAKKKGEPGVLRMSPEIVKACTEEAHKLGFKVAAHVESPIGVKVALENGVDTIEHGAKIDEEIIELFKKSNAIDVCTISPAIPLSKLPLDVTNSTEMVQFNTEIVFEGVIDCAKKCHDNGIAVGLGTDTACPFITHYDMWREVYYYSKLVNVSAKEAIYTATLQNATIAGIDNETGSIEKGKFADLLIVDNNPLADLKVLSKPAMVVYKGEIINKPKYKKYKIVEEHLNNYIDSL